MTTRGSMRDKAEQTGLGRRLLIALGARSEPSDPPALPPVHAREVEFVAYAEDCLVSGWVELAEDRITDLLNTHDEYDLLNAYVENLADGTPYQVAEVVVKRDELVMVHATGPRGHEGRRQHTRQHPLALQLGPYHVRGYIHALPGSDPIANFRRRQPMVPLTDAWVEYGSGDKRQRRRVGTLVVNRDLVDWVVPAIDDEVELPDLALANLPSGPLLKDFTGGVRGR
jgi:hypothetical protein